MTNGSSRCGTSPTFDSAAPSGLRYDAMERVQQGWIEGGQRMQRAIGLATLRLDGFVSLSATGCPGTLTTKTLRLPGGSLFVNADVRGELRAELLDSEGRVLAGYSAEDCVPIRTDGIRQMIRWDRAFRLDSLRGRAVRLPPKPDVCAGEN